MLDYNKILIFLSSLLLLVSLVILKGVKDREGVHLDNNQVFVNVVEAPKDCSKITSKGGYCTLEYNGKLYTKRAGNKFCYLVSNRETVKMLISGNSERLLFLDEYDSTDYLFGFIIMFLSIIFIIVGYWKIKKGNSTL
jgi:hypothetical protein